MARPIKSGMEKRVIGSISIPPSINEYLVKNNISKTKMFIEMFYKFIETQKIKNPMEEDSYKVEREKEIKEALELFKKVFRESLLPSNNYFEGIKKRDRVCKRIQEKYSELTKDILWNYAERTEFFVGNEKLSGEVKSEEHEGGDLNE